MIILGCGQYSEEWWAARRGIPTASAAGKIYTPTGKESTQWKGYAYELIGNELTGEDEQVKISEWMQRGLDLEPEARDYLSFDLGQEVQEIGFITTDDCTIGCSPDGLIPEQYTVEIKCPKASTQVSYLLDRKLPLVYMPQVHLTMFITGLPCIFLSYHPKMAPMKVVCKPDQYTKQIGKAVQSFVTKLDAMRERLL